MRRQIRQFFGDLRSFLALVLISAGTITTLYVWGRIWLPAVGLEAPSWGTWLWSLFMPALVALGFALLAGAVAGRSR